MTPDIPRISLAELEAPETLSNLARACESWGFFRLINHGIPETETRTFLTAVHAFFALEAGAKQALKRTETNPWGYYDRELTKNRQDWKEIFDLGIDQDDTTWVSQTPWPDAMPAFRQTMLSWHARAEAISLQLMGAICRTLDQPDHRLLPYFSPANTSFLRLNHYPVCENPANAEEDLPEAGHLGIYHHTDAGALTVLLQDNVPGLQVKHHDRWHLIDTEPGSLIINVGDLVQVWSNDRYQAPLHRVIANSTSARYSAAFFFNPTFSTDCVPLNTDAPRYRAVNWGAFRAARAAGDYADQGEEVQISHYQTNP